MANIPGKQASSETPMQQPKRARGFAQMAKKDPARQKSIAAVGGRTAHAMGRAHEFSSQEARIAGKKGGQH